MAAIEGWPYADHPQRGKDLQTKYNKAEQALFRAEQRMRRAFNSWEKARAAHKRIIKQLEKEPPLTKAASSAPCSRDA